MLRTHERKKAFSDENIRFMTYLDLNKRLKHIKWQILLLTCAPISKLPSTISTMAASYHSKELFVRSGKKLISRCKKKFKHNEMINWNYSYHNTLSKIFFLVTNIKLSTFIWKVSVSFSVYTYISQEKNEYAHVYKGMQRKDQTLKPILIFFSLLCRTFLSN